MLTVVRPEKGEKCVNFPFWFSKARGGRAKGFLNCHFYFLDSENENCFEVTFFVFVILA
jgi:hypothetical protein